MDIAAVKKRAEAAGDLDLLAALEALEEAQGKLERIEADACVCKDIRYPLSQGCIVHDKQSVIARILRSKEE